MSVNDPAYEFFALKLALLILLLPFTLIGLSLQKVFRWIFPAPAHWAWDNAANPGRKKINTADLHFPAGFLWGTATAAHQVEGGCDNNNWYKWETTKNPETGESRIRNGQKSGKAADHWNRYKEDAQLMKDIGCNAYRFSIEWSKVEPREGYFDEAVIKHYRDELDHLLRNNIQPMATLHHFTQPIWFDEKGGFEKQENISYFLRFAERIYEEFSELVPHWCTFNEPTVYTLVGWLQGSFPPGKQSSMINQQIGDAVNVLQNIMIAHVQVYKQLKAINAKPQIGMVHSLFQMRPYRSWNPIEYLVARISDQLQNGIVLDFFRTGVFRFAFPVVGPRFYLRISEAPKTVDFFGVNYYSHMFMRLFPSLQDPIRSHANQADMEVGMMTDMDYPLYPEGLYYALKRLSACFPGVPLYVTENGIADEDDSRRRVFLKRYLYAMSRAIQDGCDVRGYYYWTLVDNFEWAFGYTMRFGLYEVDYGKNGDGVGASLKRTLRPGSEYFREVAKRFASK